MTTEPTDAEIDAQWRESVAKHETTVAFVRDFARAVLAKWGAPTTGEDLYWRLHSLSKALEGSGLIDESQHPDAYSTILDAMAFVRGHPAENLYDALEMVDTLQQALGGLLDSSASTMSAASQLRMRYLLENAVELLDEHQFGGPHES